MSLHEDAVRVLTEYAAQPALREEYLEQLAAHPDGVFKACGSGHLTASALVIDPERERVLLTLHRKLRMWLQMGGHCEPGDGSLAEAALREAGEESGIGGLRLLPGGPVRLDRHRIPPPCHWHFDVQYAALAPAGAVQAISEESLDLRWFGYAEVATVADDSVLRLLAAVRERLSAQAAHP
ncbi:NUDIX hydrolase [Streptomyces albus]|uniref:NUDIX hydrolase n=1 Tax=Streptomyces albus (strain ATCC 21838 / DSM 41398 / FERM P-419 / JCM 4703 / NBRC 107858) TaxID=1081613 RepID=A0A0B5ET87_STRA4|nr:NUDIX hydrolase [Streptomyces albus]AOU76790.1 NUDIX hydrolase [Streptomyces albus]AYN32570.1 NUDIX domain-containing protein [Streptomyces albus]